MQENMYFHQLQRKISDKGQNFGLSDYNDLEDSISANVWHSNKSYLSEIHSPWKG